VAHGYSFLKSGREQRLLRRQEEWHEPSWGGRVEASQPEKTKHHVLAVGRVLVRRGFVMKEEDLG